MATFVGSLVGWAVVPDFATNQILRVGHQVAGKYLHRPIPQRGTQEYQRDYRAIYSLVVLGYLGYNFINSASNMQPNFYEVLGVPSSADDGQLKTAFRNFARKHHPDRVGPEGANMFIAVRDAYEALKDPMVRFAYDRFGPDVLTWRCSTIREYLWHGLLGSSGYHVVTGLILIAYSAIGQRSPVAYWRYVLFAALLASELILVLSPSPVPVADDLPFMQRFAFSSPAAPHTHRHILTYIFPYRIAYQHVLFLHQLFLLLSVALSRVVPTIFPSGGDVISPAFIGQALGRLTNIAKGADSAVLSMLNSQLHSVHNNPETPSEAFSTPRKPLTNLSPEIMELLTDEMELMVIESALKREARSGPLRTTIEAALERISRKRNLKDGHGNLKDAPSASKKKKRSKAKKGLDVEGDEVETEVEENQSMGEGRLPSPRPSPSPQPELRRRQSAAKTSS